MIVYVHSSIIYTGYVGMYESGISVYSYPTKRTGVEPRKVPGIE